MTKRMLIDATHPEETRVVVVNGTRLEQFDVETSTKKQIKGNVYLAKVVRVEPSLQAAFVEYGGNRHGFLAFSEIHPDYYQIPVADRQALLAEQEADHAENGDSDSEGDEVETLGGDEVEEVRPRSRNKSTRDYKIQEVVKRRQILLVQVVKEERGNKGAALTTYLSLAGRYCVLMPNTARGGGGVSRKITNAADRKRLKEIMQDLDVPSTMAVILRTAGQSRTKAEVKRDYEYLLRTWSQIRDTTLQSRAPSLIHEEGNLIRRSIRDIYSADIEEVLVDGDEGYRAAKDFMKLVTPSHAKKVQPYKDETMPLFHRYQVDSQLDAMHSPTVQLKSGGYIVLNQTEALVAIDVNSGRATKERHIEETALKTNMEAAEEIARQLRLRDLAGLIVIDFIDMEESRNNASVERKLKESLKQDRARIQMGRISHFGLMEMSRQRLRPSLMETSFETCQHCGGAGMVRSVESAAVHILRVIEEEGVRRRSSEITVYTATPVALYILNNKRTALAAIELRYGFSVVLKGDDSLIPPDYRMERVKGLGFGEEKETEVVTPVLAAETVSEPEAASAVDEPEQVEEQASPETQGETDENGRRKRKRRKRKRRGPGEGAGPSDATELQADQTETGDDEGSGDTEEEAETSAATTEEADSASREGKRRRRSRRGGRRRQRDEGTEESVQQGSAEPASELQPESGGNAEAVAAETAQPEVSNAAQTADVPAAKPRRRTRRRSAEAGQAEAGQAVEAAAPVEQPAVQEPAAEQTAGEAAAEEEKPRRRTRRAKPAAIAEAAPEQAVTEVPGQAAKEQAVKGNGVEPAAAEPAPAASPEPVKPAAQVGSAAVPEEKEPRRKRGWWQRILP